MKSDSTTVIKNMEFLVKELHKEWDRSGVTKASVIISLEEVEMAIDKEAIKEHIRGILVALGDDPDREGLKETPDRVARMYEEVFEGMNYTNDEIAEMFGKTYK